MTSTTALDSVDQPPVMRGRDLPVVDWKLIFVEDGKHVVYPLQFHGMQTGTTALHALRKEYKRNQSRSPWYYTGPYLEDAIISPFCVGDPESQDYPRRVIIKETKSLPELTEAFYHPESLLGTGADFLRHYEQFNSLSATRTSEAEVHGLFFKVKPSKHLLVVGLAVHVLISAAVGAITGKLAQNPAVGVAGTGASISLFIMIYTYLFGVRPRGR